MAVGYSRPYTFTRGHVVPGIARDLARRRTSPCCRWVQTLYALMDAPTTRFVGEQQCSSRAVDVYACTLQQMHGEAAVVRKLLQSGASVGLVNHYGHNALILAAMAGQRDIVALLLESIRSVEWRVRRVPMVRTRGFLV